MSVVLPVVNLGAFVAGQKGTLNWSNVGIYAGLEQYHTVGNGYLQLYNESACGLLLQMDQSGDQTFIPAGAWRTLTLGPADVSLSFTVQYVLNSPLVSSLIAIYYTPGEEVDDPGILGNSPIGLGSAVPTSITQVIQDGQATALTILESTPTASAQTLLMTTDGKFTMAGLMKAPQFESDRVNASGPVFLWRGTANGANAVMAEFFPTDVAQAWEIIYRLAGDLSIFEGVSAVEAMRFKAGAGVSMLGGQATVGNLGLPPIVAQTAAGGVHVTTTAATTILSFTAPATGLYRLSAAFEIGHAGSNTITYSFGYTGPNAGAGQADTFFRGASAINALVLPGGGAFETNTVLIAALTGTAITFTYTNATAGPTDFVYGFIERLQ